jgi:hypothetical protein
VLASGHWYESTLGGLAVFVAFLVATAAFVSLMLRWDSGVDGAVWALVGALFIFAAFTGFVVWLWVGAP